MATGNKIFVPSAHEMPNDFWRMSDDALKILFGPATGFEVVDAGMAEPVQIMPPAGTRYGAFLQFPLYHAYAASFILARKVAGLKRGAVRWPMPDMAAQSGAYPAHGASREGEEGQGAALDPLGPTAPDPGLERDEL